MIIAMRQIAKHIDSTDAPDPLRRVMTLHQRIDKVIVLRVKKTGAVCEYERASIVDFDSDKATQYLYRQGPPNGPGATPAALITDIEKTFPKKVLAWFTSVPKWETDVLQNEEIGFVSDIGGALKTAESRVIKDVNGLLASIDRSKGNTLLTIQINEDGENYYLGESDVFVKLFLEFVKQSYYKKYGTTSKGHGVCYVCNDEKEVYGFVTDIFSFYTLDKRGFAPGLDVSEGWKAFPVCFDCALALETAKQYLDDNLLFNFYNAKYYLIPKSVTDSEDSLDEILSVFSEQDKGISVADDSGRLTTDEKEILKYISSLSDSIVLNFLFYIMEQSAMRILGYMEDVLPSRI
ncbi:MAG: TM1802 family CRISPR-associated protein, partial [Candidatus Thorarchaeota archaeon]|nr:TM1802 family CRISPR-associated protein [Candidatus Thorarchaeota archaeon]